MRLVAQRFKADELAIVRDFMRQAKEVFQRQLPGAARGSTAKAGRPGSGPSRARPRHGGVAGGKVGWLGPSQVGTGVTAQ